MWCATGGGQVENKSRAEYFRERRKTRKTFTVLYDRKRIEALEERLKEQGKTRVQWFEEKLREELGE